MSPSPPELPAELREELDEDYLIELSRLQVELLKLQESVIERGLRVVVIFEGRDTAGKGGAILRFTQHLRPRERRIVALAKPSDTERGQWYFQRYIARLPNPGEMVFFDRSWYNRAVVEPVMGFCTEAQHQLFMRQVIDLERLLVEDGLVLVKLWYSIDATEQQRRLADRKTNPLKRWKLSAVDAMAQQNWERFTRYKEAMFQRTSTEYAPWIIVRGNDKKSARLESIRYLLSQVDYHNKGQPDLRLDYDAQIINVVKGPTRDTKEQP